MASRSRRLAVSAVLCLAVAGCDTGDGRALAEPAPGATAPPPPTSETTTVTTGTTPVAVQVTSTAFVAGGALPAEHTCDGADISPPLAWTGVPAGTVELAVTVRDADVSGFVHWVVAGIDPAVVGLGAGGVPEGAVEAMNGFGTVGWRGPCPPDGEVHRYDITVHALTTPSGVTAGAVGSEAAAAVEAVAAPRTTLTATYGRPA